MRIVLPLTIAACTHAAFAQNQFEIYPNEFNTGTVVYSRGDAGNGQGALFQGYPPSHFRGLGDNGTDCAWSGFEYFVEDQNGITQESYTLAVRRGDDLGGPVLGAAGALFAAPLTTPPAAAGAQVIQVTVALVTPLPRPCEDHVFVGHQFEATADWPATDGLAAAVYLYAQDPALAGRPNHAWQFIGDPEAGTVSQPQPLVVNMGVRTAAAVMSIGVSSQSRPHFPDYGVAGMYPDVTASPGADDGLIFRVRDGTNANGSAIVLFGTGLDPAFPLAFLGIEGSLRMTIHLIGQFTTGTLNEGGESVIVPPWLDTGRLRRFAGAGFLYFQTLTFTPGAPPTNLRATNAVGTKL